MCEPREPAIGASSRSITPSAENNTGFPWPSAFNAAITLLGSFPASSLLESSSNGSWIFQFLAVRVTIFIRAPVQFAKHWEVHKVFDTLMD